MMDNINNTHNISGGNKRNQYLPPSSTTGDKNAKLSPSINVERNPGVMSINQVYELNSENTDQTSEDSSF
jgi:hypothetical protein